MSYINVIIRDIPEMIKTLLNIYWVISMCRANPKRSTCTCQYSSFMLSKHFLTMIGSPIFNNQDAKRFLGVKWQHNIPKIYIDYEIIYNIGNINDNYLSHSWFIMIFKNIGGYHWNNHAINKICICKKKFKVNFIS